MPNDLQPILLDVAQAAEALNLGKDKIYELVLAGEIPHLRLGERTIRFPYDLLRKWAESRAASGPVALDGRR